MTVFGAENTSKVTIGDSIFHTAEEYLFIVEYTRKSKITSSLSTTSCKIGVKVENIHIPAHNL